jgi:hypothetical protein
VGAQADSGHLWLLNNIAHCSTRCEHLTKHEREHAVHDPAATVPKVILRCCAQPMRTCEL